MIAITWNYFFQRKPGELQVENNQKKVPRKIRFFSLLCQCQQTLSFAIVRLILRWISKLFNIRSFCFMQHDNPLIINCNKSTSELLSSARWAWDEFEHCMELTTFNHPQTHFSSNFNGHLFMSILSSFHGSFIYSSIKIYISTRLRSRASIQSMPSAKK